MKKFIFLMTLLFSSMAQARSMTFVCSSDQWEITFSTNVDDQAVEVRRVYEYASDTTIFVRAPIDLNSDQTWAFYQIVKNGKTYTGRAFCLTEAQ